MLRQCDDEEEERGVGLRLIKRLTTKVIEQALLKQLFLSLNVPLYKIHFTLHYVLRPLLVLEEEVSPGGSVGRESGLDYTPL